MNKVARARAGKRIKDALHRVTPEDAKIILAEQLKVSTQKAVELEEQKPGQVIQGLKTPWHDKEAADIDGVIEFTPIETVPFTWNGIRYQFINGVSIAIPKTVYEEYRRLRKEGFRDSNRKQLPDLGYENLERPGFGALTSEV